VTDGIVLTFAYLYHNGISNLNLGTFMFA